MKRLFIFLVALLTLANFTHHMFAEEEKKGTGLKPLTPEEIDYIEHNWQKVLSVKPNKIGALRLKENIRTKFNADVDISSYSNEEEFITYLGKSPHFRHNDNGYSTALPVFVDNSALPSFPPIGNQESLGSCVGWASTYYQATHEIGLLNGYNNKTSFQRVLSPKWTYNLLNGGQDGGLIITTAYNLLAQNGATSITNFPYDANFRTWDVNEDHWVSAISNRLTPAKLVPFISIQNLDLVKQILNNGHLLSFGTYVSSWFYTKVGDDSSNPFIGQKAVSRMTGRAGGHHVTIVGYNDDIWIDVNGNGVVDAGEKGAFLVANSWGNTWGNKGFMWISYDAFYQNSMVPGGSTSNRVPIGDALNSNFVLVTPIAANYSPSLIAKFSIGQTVRKDIGIKGGQSNLDVTQPTMTFLDYALNHKGGSFAFDGTTSTNQQIGHFALDMTNLLPVGSIAMNRYYLSVDDNAVGNPTSLLNYSLIDLIHNNEVKCTQIPLNVDATVMNPYVDYAFTDVGPVTPPVVSITSPENGAVLQGVVNAVVNASSPKSIAYVEFYIDSVLYLKDTSAPYVLAIDTLTLSPGPHNLTVVAYDTIGQSSSTFISFTVNSQTPTSIYINAGGQALTFYNINWQKDAYFSPSSWDRIDTTIANPIYKTMRWGNFSYNIPVPNGKYRVKLKMIEPRYTREGLRVFNVAINAIRVLTNFDLAKVVGYQVPCDRSYSVSVTNGSIKIDFTPVVGNAVVSGIAITPQ